MSSTEAAHPVPDRHGQNLFTTDTELHKLLALSSDTLVLPIYLDTEKEANFVSTPRSAYAMARQQLALLASESGNSVYQARKLKDLEDVYPQVMRDLSTVYSIGYRPTHRARDGSWRDVTVQLSGHSELAVRTRQGYYASRQ